MKNILTLLSLQHPANEADRITLEIDTRKPKPPKAINTELNAKELK